MIAGRGASLARAAGAMRDRWSARRAGLMARAVTLRAAPAPLSPGEAARAARTAAGGSPFASTAPAAVNFDAAHGFAWLDDARAAARPDREALRSWVFDWLRRFGAGGGPGWRADLAGLRLAHLAAASPLLLRGAADADRRLLLLGVDAHLRFLAARAPAAPEGLARIAAAAGLALGGLASGRGDADAQAGARLLGAAAAQCVDGDGAIASRSPEMLGRIFALLAWSAEALQDGGLTPDARHVSAMARAGQALRALRLGDGGLPMFHGGGDGADALLDEAFARAGAATRGARRVSAMGFARIAAGRATALIDAAPPPATGTAGASTLALAFSYGDRRLFDAIGPGDALGREWAVAARATAAHSAVEVAGVSSARLAPAGHAAHAPGRPFIHGPITVGLERARDVEGDWLMADHDGYLSHFGLTVTRRLRLSPDGRDLRGEDIVAAVQARERQRFDRAAQDGAIAFCVRFHLGDGVAAELISAQEAALRPGDGAAWTMRVDGGALRLDPSVRGRRDGAGPQPAQQLVIVATARQHVGRIAWALTLSRAPSEPASRGQRP